jgi:hypothetical protein
MFLISGLRPTTGFYISIFKVDLAGNKMLIELGYGMDITPFNLLFKLHIYSRCPKFRFPINDFGYHKFFKPSKISALFDICNHMTRAVYRVAVHAVRWIRVSPCGTCGDTMV